MKYHINEESSKAAYLQLYEQLRKDIVSGIYPYGTKLPSKRILAEETGVSVITIQHSYAILCDEGYVESRQRSGYFVIYKESDFLSMMEGDENTPNHVIGQQRIISQQHVIGQQHVISPHRVINQHHVKNEFPFSVLAKTMRKVLTEYGESILVKSPNHGLVELRQAIASYLARSSGITVKSEQIIIGSGAEYLYSLIVQLLGKERIFGLESPSYDKIRRVYEANGVTCDMLKLGYDGIKTSELERTEASVLHITPFNSFPSGITASASKRSEYIRWARKHNGYIIEDNYDSELTVSKKNVDTVFSLAVDCPVIYLNTFSETVAPSIRVGYMVLPEKMLTDFESYVGFYSCTVPVFEQYVLAELINNGDFERHINRTRRARRKQK